MIRKTISLLFILVVLASFVACYQAQPASATTLHYTFSGPYLDNYPALSGINTVKVYPTGAISFDGGSTLPISFYLKGTTNTTNGVADTLTSFSWNISATQSRRIDIPTGTNETYYLHIPDTSTETIAAYTLSVTDYVGITNAYMKVTRTQSGSLWNTGFIEQHSLTASIDVPFYLAQFETYQFTLTCDQGSYSREISTGSDTTIIFPILPAMFPESTVSTPTASVVRTNGTTITATYSAGGTGTNWLTYNITHVSGTTTITDYPTTNTTGNTQTIVWSNADSLTDYQAIIVASINGTQTTWAFQVPSLAGSNPWNGIWDFLGQNTPMTPSYYSGWPAGMTSNQIAQLAAMGIIMLALGIGSFRNAGASMFVACCIAGIMFALGWWNGGLTFGTLTAIPEIGLAFVVAVLTHMSEKKSEASGLS